MERRYISPEMDIIEFDTNDVITTSGELGGEKPGLTDVIDVNTMKLGIVIYSPFSRILLQNVEGR